MQIREWEGLNPTQQRLVALAAVLDILLLAAALFDLSRRSPEQIHGSKTIWKMAIFFDFVGPGAYFLFGRRRD